jgi:hypothetical protein
VMTKRDSSKRTRESKRDPWKETMNDKKKSLQETQRKRRRRRKEPPVRSCLSNLLISLWLSLYSFHDLRFLFLLKEHDKENPYIPYQDLIVKDSFEGLCLVFFETLTGMSQLIMFEGKGHSLNPDTRDDNSRQDNRLDSSDSWWIQNNRTFVVEVIAREPTKKKRVQVNLKSTEFSLHCLSGNEIIRVKNSFSFSFEFFHFLSFCCYSATFVLSHTLITSILCAIHFMIRGTLHTPSNKHNGRQKSLASIFFLRSCDFLSIDF